MQENLPADVDAGERDVVPIHHGDGVELRVHHVHDRFALSLQHTHALAPSQQGILSFRRKHVRWERVCLADSAMAVRAGSSKQQQGGGTWYDAELEGKMEIRVRS